MHTNTIPNKTDKIKILFDLKPALDGYSGIPQECRLLFKALQHLNDFQTDGLIQHGGRYLRTAIPLNKKMLHPSKKINRLSRTIVSLYEKPFSDFFEFIKEKTQRYFSLLSLRYSTFIGKSIKSSLFEPENFEDFLWQDFFRKTLRPETKDIVTSAKFRILTHPRINMHKAGLISAKYTHNPSYAMINTKGYDFFIAQTPFPGRVSKETTLIVRYHDAVPIFMPHTIDNKSFHQASHFYSLQQNVRTGAWFSCVSNATKEYLLKIFPEIEDRVFVIHNIVSDVYFEDESPKKLVLQIINNRLGMVDAFSQKPIKIDDENQTENFNYIIMVSTLEPRKNHKLLIRAWERLKYSSMTNLKLIIVGNMGWDQGPILQAIKPWAENGEIYYLNNVPSTELRVLYRHALATICPSLLEGFDYSGVEAMMCGSIVISSDIPVHREIYGNASIYFNPYSPEDAESVIRYVLSEDGKNVRESLKHEARKVVLKYTEKTILPKWNEFLMHIKMTKKVR